MSRELGVQFARDGRPRQRALPRPGQHAAAPGAVREGRRSARRRRLVHVPMGRFAEPEEMAYAVLFLASDESQLHHRQHVPRRRRHLRRLRHAALTWPHPSSASRPTASRRRGACGTSAPTCCRREYAEAVEAPAGSRSCCRRVDEPGRGRRRRRPARRPGHQRRRRRRPGALRRRAAPSAPPPGAPTGTPGRRRCSTAADARGLPGARRVPRHAGDGRPRRRRPRPAHARPRRPRATTAPEATVYGAVEVTTVPGIPGRRADRRHPRRSAATTTSPSGPTRASWPPRGRPTARWRRWRPTGDRFCVAVQWHPETAADVGLLAGLVRAAAGEAERLS